MNPRVRRLYMSLVMIAEVVKIPPPPMPEIKRETINIFMLLEYPQPMIPIAAKIMADWLAPLLPMALLSRPYRGVNVHVASKYDVPNQLAWLELLKSEDIDGTIVGTSVRFNAERN